MLAPARATKTTTSSARRHRARSLSQLTGVRVEDFGRLAAPGANGLFDVMSRSGGLVIPPDRPAESHRRVRRFTIGNRELEAGHFYENLAVEDDVEVVGDLVEPLCRRRADGDLAHRRQGQGALRRHLSDAGPDAALADRTFADAGVEPLVPTCPMASK